MMMNEQTSGLRLCTPGQKVEFWCLDGVFGRSGLYIRGTTIKTGGRWVYQEQRPLIPVLLSTKVSTTGRLRHGTHSEVAASCSSPYGVERDTVVSDVDFAELIERGKAGYCAVSMLQCIPYDE